MTFLPLWLAGSWSEIFPDPSAQKYGSWPGLVVKISEGMAGFPPRQYSCQLQREEGIQGTYQNRYRKQGRSSNKKLPESVFFLVFQRNNFDLSMHSSFQNYQVTSNISPRFLIYQGEVITKMVAFCANHLCFGWRFLAFKVMVSYQHINRIFVSVWWYANEKQFASFRDKYVYLLDNCFALNNHWPC